MIQGILGIHHITTMSGVAQQNESYYKLVYFREPGGVLFELAPIRRGSPLTNPLRTWVRI